MGSILEVVGLHMACSHLMFCKRDFKPENKLSIIRISKTFIYYLNMDSYALNELSSNPLSLKLSLQSQSFSQGKILKNLMLSSFSQGERAQKTTFRRCSPSLQEEKPREPPNPNQQKSSKRKMKFNITTTTNSLNK